MTQESLSWASTHETQKHLFKKIYAPLYSLKHYSLWLRHGAKVSFNRGLDKDDMVHIYYRILFSRKKGRNTAICDNMDGP